MAVGSNLGNRRGNIRQAINMTGSLPLTRVCEISPLFENKPVGGPRDQGDFLNGAFSIKTGLAPRDLLSGLKKIERDLGRRPTVRNGPRPIDLDILWYAGKSVDTPGLRIPHPEMFKRDFVLRPLLEIL
ncbi:MAG: 2-amino-4-hydroxy-6-hydroxymethyldihydropteridine diphosphokinase [Candidatus Omnitrophota bacterium]